MSDTGLRRIGRIRRKRSSEIEHSPWGVNFFVPGAGVFADKAPGQLPANLDVIDDLAQCVAELGVKWARIELIWEQTSEKKDGMTGQRPTGSWINCWPTRSSPTLTLGGAIPSISPT